MDAYIAGLIDGSSSGHAINMGGGNNSLLINGGSASILGGIDGGTGGLNFMTIDPGAGNSFSYAGSISDFSLVEFDSGLVTLSGASTYSGATKVAGGVLELDGANRISAASSLDLDGGTLDIANAGGANGQSFDCLALSNNSTIDLNSTSMTFNCVGAIGAGKTLTVTNYLDTVSPDYAFRFAGNWSTSSSFLALIGDTMIDGEHARFLYDGAFTNVLPTPEPSTLGIFTWCGIAGIALRLRQRRKSPDRAD